MDLKGDRFPVAGMIVGTVEGIPSPERIFKKDFKVVERRARLHVACDFPAKFPRRLNNKIGNEIRSIFYPTTREKALEFFQLFISKRETGL